jgi:hypothetical protein
MGTQKGQQEKYKGFLEKLFAVSTRKGNETVFSNMSANYCSILDSFAYSLQLT